MTNWPLSVGGNKIYEVGANRATSLGESIVPDGSAHTKGAWEELIAAATYDCCGLIVNMRGVSGGAHLIDIGIGGAGAEVVLVPNLFTYRTSVLNYRAFIPINIPKGSRISARQQSSVAGNNVSINLMMLPRVLGGPAGYQKCVEYGSVPTSTSITTFDPGGTANTLPAAPYTEVVAATTHPIKAIVPLVDHYYNRGANTYWLMNVGVGASEAEVDLIPNIFAAVDLALDVTVTGYYPPIPVNLPAGVRLSARCQCTVNTADQRLMGLILYCLY